MILTQEKLEEMCQKFNKEYGVELFCMRNHIYNKKTNSKYFFDSRRHAFAFLCGIRFAFEQKLPNR